MKAGRLAAVAFLCGGLLPLAGAAPAACAAEGPHAVLVVDTEASGGQFRYCVALPDGSVSGIELIQLASEQHGLQYRLGYGGNAVCQLAGVGYDSDECLKDGPEFWGYWRGDSAGGWAWSSSGAGATVVRDGDVDGWSWGTGNDGSSHPAPPATTFASVCGKRSGGTEGRGTAKEDRGEGRDDRKERTDKKPHAAPAASPDVVGDTGTQPKAKEKRARVRDKGRPERKRQKRKARTAGSPSPSPSPSPFNSVAARSIPAEPTSTGGGPPVGGLLAGVATLGFVVTGIVLQRRRTSPR